VKKQRETKRNSTEKKGVKSIELLKDSKKKKQERKMKKGKREVVVQTGLQGEGH